MGKGIKMGGGSGGGIPSSMLEKVTAPALENITVGQPVEYRMYPGEDVFNYTTIPMGYSYVGASKDHTVLFYRRADTATSWRYLDIYKLIDGAYILTDTLDTGVGTLAYVAAVITDDKQYIFAAKCVDIGSGTPTVYWYKHNGSTYVEGGALTNVGWSLLLLPGDTHLIHYTLGNAFLQFTKLDFTTDTFTKLDAPTVITTGGTLLGMAEIRCDAAGEYIVAVAGPGSTDNDLFVYKRAGDNFSLITKIALDSANSRCSIHPTGKYLCRTRSAGTVNLYKFENDVPTLISGLTGIVPSSDSMRSVFSPDGKYLYISTNSAPYLWVIKIDAATDTFTKLANPSGLPTQYARVLSIRNDGKQLLYPLYGPGNALVAYATGVGAHIVALRNLRDARYYALNQYGNYKLGIADATVTAGQPCTATMFKVLNEVIT